MKVKTPLTASEFALVRAAAEKTRMTTEDFSRVAVAWIALEVAALGQLVIGPSRIEAIRDFSTPRKKSADNHGFYTSAEFAKIIGRHKQWVTDRCSAGVIKTLPGGKPWRIPLAELSKWNETS